MQGILHGVFRITVALAMLLGAAPVLAADRTDSPGTLPPGVQRTTITTAPLDSGEGKDVRERKYRSCLFTYLPRVGSDVAAELIRKACEAEYLRPRSR